MPIRDILFTAIVSALLLLAFRTPVVGAYLWVWLGVMAPNKMTYGFAFDLPFAQVTAIVTMLGMLFTRKRHLPPRNAVVVLQLMLLAWMTITTPFAIAAPEVAWDRWIFVMKIQLMLLVVWMLVVEPKQLRVFVWVLTMSVAFFGIKGGIWTLLTGGGGRVWGPPGGFLEDNNALAAGLVTVMPLLYYLRQTESKRWVKVLLLAAMVFCVFSILGSQSRGALLGLLAMGLFLGLKSKYPFRTSLGLVLLVGAAIAFMPDTWSTRMDTMQTYEQESSAMSRLYSWHTLWNVVRDRPLVGAGFQADNIAVFERYAPTGSEWAMFTGRVWVAHSIYFQMLGEHGFPGLVLYLLLGAAAWFKAGRIARAMREDAEFGSWMPLLMRMVQVSMVGFGTSGAFLSLAYLDLPFYVIGLVVMCDGMVRRRAAAAVAGQAAAAPNESPPAASPRWIGR